MCIHDEVQKVISVPIRGLFNLTIIVLILVIKRLANFRPHQGII